MVLEYFTGVSFSQERHVPTDSNPVFQRKALISEHCPVKFNISKLWYIYTMEYYSAVKKEYI